MNSINIHQQTLTFEIGTSRGSQRKVAFSELRDRLSLLTGSLGKGRKEWGGGGGGEVEERGAVRGKIANSFPPPSAPQRAHRRTRFESWETLGKLI